MQDEFGELGKRYGGQHLWARGYFCATVGRDRRGNDPRAARLAQRDGNGDAVAYALAGGLALFADVGAQRPDFFDGVAGVEPLEKLIQGLVQRDGVVGHHFSNQ